MKNKLILFDWGNIVESHTTGYSCRKAWNDLFRACGYSGNKEIFKSLSEYRLTAIKTDNEFSNTFELLKKDFNFNCNYKEFIKKYKEIFKNIDYYKNVRDYELSLKDKCYIGILSNLTIFDKERLDKQVGLDNYDYVFLSFEMECKKPDIIIFKKVQEQLPFKKEDILFIDDSINNIKVAEEFGWNTLCATGLELDKIKKVCNNFITNKK